MKSFLTTCVLFSLLLLIGCNDSKEKTPEQNPSAVVKNLPMKDLLELAKRDFRVYKRDVETKEGSVGVEDYFTGDFNADGREDIVVYYDIEPTDGGNAMMAQGLVLYENTGQKVKFIMDYEPNYLFDFVRMNNSKIYINQVDYGPNDARCCPSIHTLMELTLTGDQITETEADLFK